MQTTNAIEKKSLSRIAQFFPQTTAAKMLFFLLLPMLFLIANLGVSFLLPLSLTSWIPLIALVGTVACVVWKTMGLSCSYLALVLFLLFSVKELSSQELLWQIGLVASLALNYLIVFLSVEEIASLFSQVIEESTTRLNTLRQGELEMERVKNTWKDERENLEKAISKLKEEIDAREIDKQRDKKRFELIQSEIEMLTSMKEELVTEAREARQKGMELLDPAAVLKCQEKILSFQAGVLRSQVPDSSKEESVERIDDRGTKEGSYAKEMAELGEEVTVLEEEVTHLEELISHVLSG